MRPSNRIINYVLTFGMGVICSFVGIAGFVRAIYWCYLTTTGEKEFTLAACLGQFGISLVMMAIGYAIIKSAQKA